VSTPPIQAELGPTAAARKAAAPRRATLSLPVDVVLLAAVLGIAACSLITLRHTQVGDTPEGYYFSRQLIFTLLGLLVAIGVSRIDYARLREVRVALYGLMLVSILAVLALGTVQNGSRLSIQLGFFNLQTSELGKVLLAVVLAGFVVERARGLGTRETTARILLIGLIPMAIVMTMDLGSSLVYLSITLAVLFVAGTPGRHFAALAVLGALAVTSVLVVAPMAGVEVLKPYQKERLTAFLSPTDDPGDAGYQQNQSRIAIGSGEKTGRGDSATQSQYDFLPEKHTDFIFAVVGERYGFAGAALVLSLYALLIWRALRILTTSKDLFGALIAAGIVAMMLFQVFENVGMNVGIMPITGIPLPLMSYGGSSVLSTFLAVGLLLSIHAQGRAARMRKGLRPGL
jgi:rod shape determining protein RodA